MAKKIKQNSYQKITNKLLEAFEEGVVPWQKPWRSIDARPQNTVSGTIYRGANLFTTAFFGKTPFFLTYNQIEKAGGKLVNAKGTGLPVLKWLLLEEKDKVTKQPTGKKIPILKHFTVFDSSYIEGIEFPSVEKVEHTEGSFIPEVDQFIKDFDHCKVEYVGQRACYNKGSHKVSLPPVDTFESVDEFYSTFFHEIAHSTIAHFKRESLSYAEEELVAELTSAFLCAEFGVNNDFAQTASYLDNWKKALKADEKLFIKASGKAQKVADFLLLKLAKEIEPLKKVA